MSIGLFDADMAHYKQTCFNLELMKMASYYYRKGEVTVLSPSFSPERYTKFIYRMDYDHDVPNLIRPNIEYGGFAFSNDVYFPLPQDIEYSFPNVHIYEKMRPNFDTRAGKKNFSLMLNAYHTRLSLDGATVQNKYDYIFKQDKPGRSIILHDRDITGIKDYSLAIKDIIASPSVTSNIHIGNKFPIQIRSDDQFEEWINIPTSPDFTTFQIRHLMSDEFIVNILNQRYPNVSSIDYVVTASSYDENDFFERVLPVIYKQSVFFRHNRRKISLKYESNFFSDERGEMLVRMLNSFIGIMQKTKKENIRDYFYDVDSMYRHAKQLKRLPYLTKDFIDKDQARSVFEYTAEKCPQVFKDFYECHSVKLQGGNFVYAT